VSCSRAPARAAASSLASICLVLLVGWGGMERLCASAYPVSVARRGPRARRAAEPPPSKSAVLVGRAAASTAVGASSSDASAASRSSHRFGEGTGARQRALVEHGQREPCGRRRLPVFAADGPRESREQTRASAVRGARRTRKQRTWRLGACPASFARAPNTSSGSPARRGAERPEGHRVAVCWAWRSGAARRERASPRPQFRMTLTVAGKVVGFVDDQHVPSGTIAAPAGVTVRLDVVDRGDGNRHRGPRIDADRSAASRRRDVASVDDAAFEANLRDSSWAHCSRRPAA